MIWIEDKIYNYWNTKLSTKTTIIHINCLSQSWWRYATNINSIQFSRELYILYQP